MGDDINELNTICQASWSNRNLRATYDCKESITLAPMRYSLIGYDDEQTLNQFAPTLPETLCAHHKFPAIPAQDKARYTVRRMRPGFIYVFANRKYVDSASSQVKNKWQLDGCLQVQGLPRWFILKTGSHLRVSNKFSPIFDLIYPKDVLELRILFTPTELTENRLALLLSDKGKNLREKIQQFDIQAILKNPEMTTYPDIIHSNSVNRLNSDHIAEAELIANGMDYSPSTQRTAKIMDFLENQRFHIFLNQRHMIQKTLDIEKDLRNFSSQKAIGVGIVLLDPIGITQEANNLRAGAVEGFYKTYFQTSSHVSVSSITKSTLYAPFVTNEFEQRQSQTLAIENERLIRAVSAYETFDNTYTTMLACAQVQAQWKAYDDAKKEVDDCKDRIERLTKRHNNQPTNGAWRNQLRYQKAQLPRLEAIMSAAHQALLNAAHSAKMKRDNGDFDQARANAQELVDNNLINTVKANYRDAVKNDVELNNYAELLINWLKSQHIRNALDFYDPDNNDNAREFVNQVGLCMLGAEGSKSCFEVIIDEWLQPDNFTAKENILIRAMCFNQQEAMQQLQEFYDKTEALQLLIDADPQFNADNPAANSPAAQKALVDFKKLFNQWAKLFARYVGSDDRLRELQSSHPYLAGIYSVWHKMEVYLLTAVSAKFPDRILISFWRNVVLISAYGNSKAVNLWNWFARHALKNSGQDIITAAGRQEWDTLLDNKNELAKIRMATLVAVVQVSNFVYLLFKGNKTEKDWQDLYGATWVMSGACIGIGSTVIEGVIKASAQRSSAAMGTFRGLKIGGSLIGLYGAVYLLQRDLREDYGAWTKAWRNDNWMVGSLYGVRMITNSVLIASGIVGFVETVLAAWRIGAATTTATAGTTSAATGGAAMASRALHMVLRVIKPSTPQFLVILVLSIILLKAIEWSLNNRKCSVERWLSSSILRTGQVDKQALNRSVSATEISTTIKEGSYTIYSTMQEELEYHYVMINTVLQDVPADLFEQLELTDTPKGDVQ